MTLRFIDWIWHVKGRLALAPGQTSDDAFTRLAPLFRQTGTSYERLKDRLTFQKKDQAAQDRMSIFDSGTLRIENGPHGSELHYRLVSRALLFCFLAAPLFLSFAGATIVIGQLQRPSVEAEKKPEKKDVVLPQNPIDKALGAPAPEKPKKDDKKKDEGPSPTPAYVFAGIFAVLYVVGRILEARLVKRLFQNSLRAT